MRARVGAVICVGLLALVSLPMSANATFPGNNGCIAFDSGRSDPWGIFVMRPDGSSVVRLADGFQPDWSPDGTRIVYQPPSGGIRVMAADGSNQQQLSTSSSASSPTFSPDGNQIAFSDYRSGRPQIWVMGADGSNEHNISNAATNDYQPTWSPDGQTIAFQREFGFASDIFVMNVDGTNQHAVYTLGSRDADPDFSPDGTRLVFNSDNTIKIVSLDGSGVVALTSGFDEPRWSPDSTKVLFSRFTDSGEQDIFVINADGSGETNLTNHPARDRKAVWQPAPGSTCTVGPPPNTPPTLVLPSDMTIDATAVSGDVAVTFQATATDPEDGTIAPVCTPSSGSLVPIGTSTVSCSATDSGGATVDGSFSVVVQDKAPPQINPIGTKHVVISNHVDFNARDNHGCLDHGTLTIQQQGSATTLPFELPLRAPEGCGSTVLRLESAELVPGFYYVASIIAVDDKGNRSPPDGAPPITGFLEVTPTEHVVILVPGLTSGARTDDRLEGGPWLCQGGRPAAITPMSEPRLRIAAIRDAFTKAGVPPEGITFYVVDYPAKLGGTHDQPFSLGPDYCYAQGDGLFRTIVPYYDPVDTGDGIAGAVDALDKIVTSLLPGTTVDIIGHSQGVVVAAYWLATRTLRPDQRDEPGPDGRPDPYDDATERASLSKVHASISLDGPWGGITPWTGRIPKGGQGALCLGALKTWQIGLNQCRSFESWNDILQGAPPIKVIQDTSRTTERAFVATFTCDSVCLPAAGIKTTLAGVWHNLVMHDCVPSDDVLGQIQAHGCFFSDPESLANVVRLLNTSVVDDTGRASAPTPSVTVAFDGNWHPVSKSIDLDPNVMRSGTEAGRPSAQVDITVVDTGGLVQYLNVLYESTGLDRDGSYICAKNVRIYVDGRDVGLVDGVPTDDDYKSVTMSRRPICQLLFPPLVFGNPEFSIRTNVALVALDTSKSPFRLDAIELRPS